MPGDNPLWTFPGSKRFRKKKASGPGPGSYRITTTLKQAPQGGGFGGGLSYAERRERDHERSLKHQDEAGPGPGAYTVNGRRDRPISFGTKPPAKEKDSTPGPGAYTINRPPCGRQKGYSLYGRDFLPESNSSSPGPAHYMPTGGKKGGISFGQRLEDKRFSAAGELITPGPGAYSDTRTRGGGYSMVGRNFRPDLAQDVPGPGAYVTNAPQSAPGGCVMKSDGKSTRFKNHVRDGPGPGAYSLPGTLRQGGSGYMGTKPNEEDFEKDETPGPGQYCASMEGGKKGKGTFGSDERFKRGHKLNSRTPGPGQHDVAKSYKYAEPARGVSMKGRDSLAREHDKGTIGPGPGTYMQTDFHPGRGKGTSFPHSKRMPDRNDKGFIPGPGEYNVSPVRERGHGASLKGKWTTSVMPLPSTDSMYYPKRGYNGDAVVHGWGHFGMPDGPELWRGA